MTDRTVIEQAAAQWLMRRHEPDWSIDDQLALDQWLDENVAHKSAYWRLEHGYQGLNRLAALGYQHRGGEVTAISRTGRRWLQQCAAAFVMLSLIAAVLFYLRPDSRQPTTLATHRTRIGQLGAIGLADGSRIELNTGSQIRVAQGHGGRELWLDKGEIFLTVTHDRARPFVVHGGHADITVLGTRFAVRRQGSRVVVSVAEGSVRVVPASSRAESAVTLARGEIAVTDGANTLVSADAAQEIESNLAWRRGQLIFDEKPLAEAAAEFNRYNIHQLTVVGARATKMRIDGTFGARNPDGFVRLLRDAYGLQVREDERGTIIF